MQDSRNVVILTCGIVAPPDLVNDGKIAKFRLAVPFGGSEEGSDDKRGFFDAVHYRDDTNESKFIFSQIENENLKPGSNVQILGRLNNRRFTTKAGEKASRVEIVVAAMNYVSGGKAPGDGDKAAAEAVAVPDRF